MSLPRDRLLSIEEAAEYLNTTAGALRTQRHRGQDPGRLGIMVGNKCGFRLADLENWIDQRFAETRDRVSA